MERSVVFGQNGMWAQDSPRNNDIEAQRTPVIRRLTIEMSESYTKNHFCPTTVKKGL